MTDFPNFPYHPAPLATGSVERSEEACLCCGDARGYIYAGAVYGEEDLHEALCPWCIENGEAATRLGAEFVDGHHLVRAGIPRDIVDRVRFRTPSYVAWQQEQWLHHCGDACAFHGKATISDLEQASDQTIEAWERTYGKQRRDWDRSVERYQPSGLIGFYRFICRHCGLTLFAWDLG